MLWRANQSQHELIPHPRLGRWYFGLDSHGIFLRELHEFEIL